MREVENIKLFSDRLYLIHRVGRLAFSSGIFFLFLSLSSVNKLSVTPASLVILGIYVIISLYLLLSSKKPNIFEFLLDETIIFTLVIFKVFNYNFFSIFLIFPVFFSTITLGSSSGLISLIFALFLHIVFFLQKHNEGIATGIQTVLNSTALTAMFLAGLKLEKKLKSQASYIKKLERERERVEIYKRLYEISANMAHEIKNPLASIKGALELIKEGKQSDQLLEIIFRETDRLDRIVKDFLHLARPSSPVKTEIFLPEALQEILQSLQHFGKNYKLDVEPVKIKTDARGFYSMLENLIRNAFQWANSKVEIHCKKKNNTLEITIEDDGPGIKEEDKEKIFEPFYSQNPNGSGLGLSIVNKFVLEHKGTIQVKKSQLGGAKFEVKLPITGEHQWKP